MRAFFRSVIPFFMALLLAAPAVAETIIDGFVQGWFSGAENAGNDFNDFGFKLNAARVKWVGAPVEGVNVVVMPEFAGGFQLLDAFGDVNILDEGALKLRVGQFKFPFGLDRMYHPGQLDRSNYSMIDKAMFPGHPWDVGAALYYQRSHVNVAVAVIEGLGPNLGTPNGNVLGVKDRHDTSLRIEADALDKQVILGASLYSGLSNATGFVSGESHHWGGVHTRIKAGDTGIALQAEVIVREMVWAGQVESSWRINHKFKVLAYYDRFESQVTHAAGKSAVGAAVIYNQNEKVEWTLDFTGKNTGPDPTPGTSQATLQAQFNY